MKFVLEIFSLLFLFLLFRKAVRTWFGVKQVGVEISADSLRELKRYERRYQLYFWGLGLLAATLLWFFLGWFMYFYHQQYGTLEFRYEVDHFALVAPSLLMGFLIASQLAHPLTDRNREDGLGFYFRDLQQQQRGYSFGKLKLGQILLISFFALLLLYGNLKTFLYIDSSKLELGQGFKQTRSWPIEEVYTLRTPDNLLMISLQGDTIMLSNYQADESQLIQQIGSVGF